MAFKFVTLCALLAIVNAGGLVHHPVTYTQIHNVASADQIHHHAQQYSQGVEGSHIQYVPALAKTIHYTAPVHSGQVYTAPAFTHVSYGTQSYGRSLGFNEGPSSTPSSHSSESEETTTTAELSTTESTTAEAKSTEETSHASKSAEAEPTQASYQYEPSTSSGYKYEAPSSSETHSSGVPTFYKYHTSLQQHAGDHHVASVPSFVKYEVPAQTVVKYAAPAHYAAPATHYAAPSTHYAAPATHYAATAPHQTLVHYTTPSVQTVYHKTVAPQAVHVKYASPEPAVYTSFGEHPPAVYSHHTAVPATTVHHTYAAPQPSFIKYAAPVSNPGQVTYVAAAPTVYTKYGVTAESASHASHLAPAPTGFIKYGSPATITTYTAPQHSAESSSTKLFKYNGPSFQTHSVESSTESQSQSQSSNEENKDSVEVKNPESTTASYQTSGAYLPPSASQLISHQNYEVPSSAEAQYNHQQESARSLSNEHNLWSTDGASSHVSFKGFGTSYGY
ncbi:protein dissatisfaction-like [Eupeodes corollae]|uniref:protein dissatisfaction-like n=1 Tax=Eupeodes corollae TaxID=290404 RepID=UPI00248FFE02|nr:protein dissatisfaction-like [Eupeodes corollae]